MPVTQQPRPELKSAPEVHRSKLKLPAKTKTDVRLFPPAVAALPDLSALKPLQKPKHARRRVPTHKYSYPDLYAEYFVHHKDHRAVPELRNSYLRPNAKFVGEQQSGAARYDIKVELKTVDLVSSVVTGFFQISGLTEEHPLITTCFKGEIINNPLNKLEWGSSIDTNKYSFITEEHSWGSFPQNDMDHWRKLTSSPKEMSEDELRDKLHRIHTGEQDNQYVYMRWKEEFLLPDSRIKLLKGASFEGFYYIVLNMGGGRDQGSDFSSSMIPGTMSGLYFHNQSDKFQLLSLRYVEDREVAHAFEFV